MEEDNLTYIGTRNIWGGIEPFGLRAADRRQHCYVIGQTGTGKSTLLRNLIVQDIQSGRGVGVIDPHGDLAAELLDCIPAWRTDDLVYFNPADHEHPIGLNLLHRVEPQDRHLVTSGIVSAFKSIWRDSWGPRLEYILYAAVAALQECDNVTLLGVQRMLSDEAYRHWVVRQVKDPVVAAFWTHEFTSFDKRFLAEILAPVQNKVGQLLMAPPIRNILGQVKSKIDMRFIMDRRRIFIANLSKGKLGEDKANLLGALLVTQFQHAAMSRADVAEEERVDFHLYVDEFHNFTTDSFASILSEARKYRLCLTLSHQYTAQLPDSVRNAVFGNVGTIVTFRVGESDAKVLERETGGQYTAKHISNMRNHEICVKMLEAGSGQTFLGKTLSPIDVRGGRKENMIRRSREKYASRRTLVEDKIERWMARWTF